MNLTMNLNEILKMAREGKSEKALEELLALKGTPDEALALFNRGLILKGLDRPLEALGEFEAALNLLPLQGEIWNEIGLIHDGEGHMTRAEDHYKKAVEVNPDLADAWNNLGVCSFLKNNWDEAKTRFERALALDKEMASAWFNLRDTCKELGDEAGAQAAELRRREIEGS